MSLVIVALFGGLGNQMFQLAAGRALARRCRARLKLDLSFFRTAARPYALDTLSIQAAPVTLADLQRSGAPRFYQEPHFHFDPAFATLRAPVHLRGHWASEKYFADAALLLRRELAPRAPLEPENAAVAARIDAVNAVSLHVRRGDYVTHPVTHRHHGTCSVAYYHRAVEHIAARVPDPHLFVFSDDSEWSRDNLRFDVPATHVCVNGPERGYRDMQLMARCRHHVIANSTFSWWGAWLDPSPDKIVVAPARWFDEAPDDTRDLIPEGWVRL